ncbi:Glyoxalase/Bleomycin resistance protein/Dioxygenase superfamily protein [Nitrosospira sp. Nl5]|uniref:ArsI/CadI family heavy metal resistance metalloenzyme n=1 Tax=Nitrosospira sp. Nl5 TaxID=200120 RepID=UPI000885DD50|nr:ArsI/CadI family heavy metal resistance metalloenzyme [Nitrosospira sp. Nl5]SCY29487.1 Glyoxalase/Bleomycin resistance protein/Dioxygenase superfamily protein [Nitrosospira sp. Nl5]
MKRFHVHIAVDDLDANIRFYSTVFGAPPSVTKADYAKWMIEEPRINFAISNRGAKTGLDHLGFQVDSDAELGELRRGVAEAEIAALDQPRTKCCYARSDKYWIVDPQGIAWETYHTLGEVEIYGTDVPKARIEPKPHEAGACCVPVPKASELAI